MAGIPPIHLFPPFVIELPRESFYEQPTDEMEYGGGFGAKQTKCLLKRWEHILCIYIIDAAICQVSPSIVIDFPRATLFLTYLFYPLHLLLPSITTFYPYTYPTARLVVVKDRRLIP